MASRIADKLLEDAFFVLDDRKDADAMDWFLISSFTTSGMEGRTLAGMAARRSPRPAISRKKGGPALIPGCLKSSTLFSATNGPSWREHESSKTDSDNEFLERKAAFQT